MSKKSVISFIFGLVVILIQSGCVSRGDIRGFRQYDLIAGKTTPNFEHTEVDRNQPVLTEEAGLSDYLAYAALNNAGLEAAFNRWKAALERIPQVISLPDPRFSYRYFIHEVETRVGAQRQAFEIAQMFPWFGELELRGDEAMQAANVQRQRYEAAKLKLFFQVKDAYYEYYYLAKAIAVSQENVNLVKHLENVARTRYKTAGGSHRDIIRAQVELGKIEDQLRTLQELRGPIMGRLNAALNRPVMTAIAWPEEFEIEDISITDQELQTWLAENNPELKALDFEITRQKYITELAKKEYFPDLSLGVNYIDTAGSTGGRDPSDDGKDAIGAMVSVNIPIWRGKYAAGVRQAKAGYQSSIHDKIEKTNTLGAQLKLEAFRFRDAERKIDLYRNALLAKAEQSLKVTETDFLAGRGAFLDLIDAQRVLLEFQLAYERAKANYEQSLAKLEMLVGREIPRSGNENRASNVKDNDGDNI